MSKWNRPMRTYRPASAVCADCGQPVRPSSFGGWDHVVRQPIKSPTWHQARPVFDIAGYLDQ